MVTLVTEDTLGFVRKIGLNRPDKRNAMNVALIEELSRAYARAEADDEVRVVLLHAHGETFTAGLDLMDVLPRLNELRSLFEGGGAIDPWATYGRARTKPLVAAVHGKCFTLGIELLLAADVTIAADDASFAQIEIDRGLFPFGGGTARWVQTAGWGNAMRYMLTGDTFDAAEAYRLGVVQQVVARAALLETALAVCARIAAKPPRAARATLESARLALHEGERAAAAQLQPAIMQLAATEDAREALMAFMQKRTPVFHGR